MDDHTPTFPENISEYAPWVATHGLVAPYGKCQCGCGDDAPIAKRTYTMYGVIKGQPIRYIAYHYEKIPPGDGPNPSGLCMCGCGQPTPNATENNRRKGWIKGKPLRYISNHKKPRPKYATLREHFYAYLTPGAPDECWEWQGSILAFGYGQLRDRGKQYTAHRLSWELHYGPITDGLWVLHKCDRPICCNPNHLFLGTHDDNMADMAKKGRGRNKRPK